MLLDERLALWVDLPPRPPRQASPATPPQEGNGHIGNASLAVLFGLLLGREKRGQVTNNAIRGIKIMIIKSVLTVFIIVVFLGCQCTAFAVSIDESNFNIRLEQIRKIAKSKDIIRDMGQDYVTIDGSQENGIVIIHYLGGGSHSKYEMVTPIIDINSDDIYIDCSYGKNYNNSTGTISFEGTCRGKTEATPDFFESGGENGFSVTYSSSASWMKKIKNVVNCKSPSGLVYSDIYFIRCQEGDLDGLTENVTITALSPDFTVLFVLHGYEFVPVKPPENVKTLMFIGLKRESHYEIVKIDLPKEGNPAFYKPEKILYSFSIDETKSAIVKQKSHLYSNPTVSGKTKKYLIAGDKVTVGIQKADWCRINYSGGKEPLQMWIMCDALEVHQKMGSSHEQR